MMNYLMSTFRMIWFKIKNYFRSITQNIYKQERKRRLSRVIQAIARKVHNQKVSQAYQLWETMKITFNLSNNSR